MTSPFKMSTYLHLTLLPIKAAFRTFPTVGQILVDDSLLIKLLKLLTETQWMDYLPTYTTLVMETKQFLESQIPHCK